MKVTSKEIDFPPFQLILDMEKEDAFRLYRILLAQRQDICASPELKNWCDKIIHELEYRGVKENDTEL